MLPVKGAILFQFQLFLGISPILFGCIVLPFTFRTLQGDKLHRRLFTRHNKPLNPALTGKIISTPPG
jgi:hypothetical protein